MKRYKYKNSNNIVVVLNERVAGMGGCMGTTFVIYGFENVHDDYLFVMEAKEFHEKYTEITPPEKNNDITPEEWLNKFVEQSGLSREAALRQLNEFQQKLDEIK